MSANGHQFSHRTTAVHGASLADRLVHDMLLWPYHAAIRRPFRSATLSHACHSCVTLQTLSFTDSGRCFRATWSGATNYGPYWPHRHGVAHAVGWHAALLDLQGIHSFIHSFIVHETDANYSKCKTLVQAFLSSRLDYCNALLYGVGEMPSKLWLIVANLQMHRPTLPPKGSAI